MKRYEENGNFEFELKNGNGLGKEFNENDDLIFEGEYKNGLRHGEGHEYINESEEFYGEYKYGERNSGEIVRMSNNNYEYYLFECKFLNGKVIGDVRESSDVDGLIFEGEYYNDKRNGKGKDYYENSKGYEELIFEGEYYNSKRIGKGKEYYLNGKLKFEGEYLNSKIWMEKDII